MQIEIPKDLRNGDYASGFAMQNAKVLRQKPRKVAEILVAKMDLEGTRTTLRVKPDYVKLVRTGLYPSELVFELGKRHVSLYHTDYGDLSIVVSTQSIQSTLTDDGGDLDVKYAVEVANTPVGINHLNLNIKNAEEGAISQ